MSDYKSSCGVHKVAWVLVFIGAITWGLVGVFQWNLVEAILGGWPVVERIVYILVGLSGILMLATSSCKSCKR